MSLTTYQYDGSVTYYDASATATPETATTTASALLLGIEVDNRGNADDVYLKIYDSEAPTVGTTVPVIVVKCPGGSRRKQIYGGADGAAGGGYVFSAGISFACVTDPGTAGTTSPTNAVPVTLIADEP